MNNILASAVYKGDISTDRGLRAMHLEIPGTGNKPIATPIFVLPSFAAGDTCVAGAFQTGATILVNARLYPHSDGSMYVVPTQPLQGVPKGLAMNQVHIAGGVGFIGEQRREDAFNFGLMCKAPPQKAIGHVWQDSLGFKVESWRDDAERMKRFLFVGRQISLGGTLKFESWTGKDGAKRTSYKVRVRSSQYSFFGKNEKAVESEKDLINTVKEIVQEGRQHAVYESPHQQAIAKPNVPKTDDIPF